MIIDKHPSGCPSAYVGDGVYAEWDGYQVWLRVDDRLAQRVVALEPSVMEQLYEFSNTMIRRAGIELSKKNAFENLSKGMLLADVRRQFTTDMCKVAKLTDMDRINLAQWAPDILEGSLPYEDQLTAWINSFE